MSSSQSDRGEKTPLNLEHGPKPERGCTDIQCCILFLLVWGGLAGAALYGYINGDPDTLFSFYDSDKRICGVDKDVVDYPYVYFPILNNTYLNYSVCVKRCPTNDDLTISCAGTKNIPACVDKAPIIVETFEEQTITLPNEDSDDEEPKTQTVTVFTGYHPEPFKIYNSRVMFNKVCTPDIKEDMRDSFALETTNSWIEDLNNTWDVIAGSLILSIVLGLLYLFTMRYATTILTWIMILGSIIAIAILGWVYWDKASELEETGGLHEDQISTYRTFAVVFWIGDLLLLLLVYFNTSKIRLAMDFMRATSDFVKDVPATVGVPILMFFLLLGFFAFWTQVVLYVWSCGEVHTRESGFPIVEIVWDGEVEFLIYFLILALIWIMAYFIYLPQFVIGSATALWYFTPVKERGALIRTSAKRAISYHSGSIAFGGLILLVAWPVRATFGIISDLLKKCQNIFKYLNEQAFIMMAMTGDGYTTSAEKLDSLINRFSRRFNAIGGLGEIFNFFGAIFIAATTTAVGYFIIVNDESLDLSSPLAPTIAFAIVSFIIGANFMTVCGTSADGILVCYSMDQEIKSQKGEKPRPPANDIQAFLRYHVRDDERELLDYMKN